MAIVACPMCGGPADQAIGICACGYNAREVAALERELHMWTRRRRMSTGAVFAGIAILVFVPAIWTGIATIGGLLVTIGAVFWAWSRHYSSATNRQLRTATTRTALPEARLL